MSMAPFFFFPTLQPCKDNLVLISGNRGNLGAKTYLIFAGAMLICLVVAYFQYPEIKGRTAAELDEMFGQGLPARAFKSKMIPSFDSTCACWLTLSFFFRTCMHWHPRRHRYGLY